MPQLPSPTDLRGRYVKGGRAKLCHEHNQNAWGGSSEAFGPQIEWTRKRQACTSLLRIHPHHHSHVLQWHRVVLLALLGEAVPSAAFVAGN